MAEKEKSREHLAQELAQAGKRIAELEASAATSGKVSSLYHGMFENFVESATDSFSMWDSDLNLVYLNEATLINYYPPGTKKKDVIGKHFTELVPGSVESGRYQKYLDVLDTGKPLYIDEFTPHPRFGDMYLAISVFKAGNGLGIITTDITKRKKTEEALRHSEERLRAYFENAPDAIFVYDFNGVFLDGNKKGEEITGYSRDELIGKNFIQSGLFSEEYALKAMNAVLKDVKGETTRPEEYELIRKDGKKIYLESTSFVASSGWKGEVVGIARDITERRRIEGELNDYKENLEKMVAERTTELATTNEELRESEERLRAFFENVPDILFAHNMEGQFTDINKKALEISGYSREEIIGRNVLETGILPPDQIEGVIAGLKGIEEGKSGYPYEVQLMKKDGGRITVEAVSFPIKRKGELEVMGIARDITERKRMEESLKESDEKLRTMFASLADGIVVTDLEGKIKDLNEAQLHLFGYSKKEEIVGENGFSFISEKDRDAAMKAFARLFTETNITGKTWLLKHRSGYEFPAELSVTLMKDVNGNPTDVLVVLRDKTEHNRMEKALRESESKLRAIYDSIGDGITVTDLKGTILDQNEAGLRLSGYNKRGDVIGRNGLTFISEADRDRARNDMLNVLQKGIGITTEYRLVNKHGKEFDAEVSGAMITDGTGKPTAIVNVIRDITERKHIEEALRESEAKYRTLVEQSEQGICIHQDGRIVFANNALSKINGYSLKEMYAMPPDELLTTIHPDDRENFVNRIKSRLKGEKLMPKHEYRAIRKDGTERHLETYAKRIIYKGKPAIQSTIVDITERKQWEEKLNKSKEELRSYLHQITKAQEEERKRIARELHDETIQELIALSRQLDDLIDKKIKPDADRRASRKKIEETQKKVDALLQGVRRFTRDLRPSVLDDLGLVPALEWLTSDMSKRFGIPVNISIVGTEKNIAPDEALAMFRIAQESLRNAGQHSKASQIQVNLKYTRKTVILSIVDNGAGFTPVKQISTLTKRGKLGIAGMYERAQLIDANLSIKSKRNTGATITLEVPI